MMCTVTYSHSAQHLVDTLLALFLWNAKISERKLHILLNVKFVYKIETLEYEAYLAFSDLGALALF